ncbi:MAG: methyltransferase, TIGR04325 family [Bacteroidota bacterium]
MKRAALKELMPPLLLNYLSGFFYGWRGNYATWGEAKEKCSGYDSKVILSKVKEASLKVRSGEAAYEKDSVLFDRIQYSFPLLSALSLIALENKGRLNVLDFGGSLGSSYYQNRGFFRDLQEFNWCVVEQPHFVEEGKRTFADEHLRFFHTIESCMKEHRIDLILFASVLQYLESPYLFLDQTLSRGIGHVFIDRTPVFTQGDDRITVQRVPRRIYEASYPCRILSEKKLLNCLSGSYDLLFDFETPERINIRRAALKGYFMKRKK